MSAADLRVQFYFASSEGAEGPGAPEGAGWYIAATRTIDGQFEEVIPRVRLDNKDAPKLAKVIDKLTEGKPLNWLSEHRPGISLEQAVVEATKAGGEAIKRQVQEAEELVRRLDALRARAEEFDVSEG